MRSNRRAPFIPVILAILFILASAVSPASAQPSPAPAPPARVMAVQGVSVESAAILMSGQEGGEISLGALALPIRDELGKTRVLLRLRLDGPPLLAGETGDTLRAEVLLYALDAGNGVQASLLEAIEVDLAAYRNSIERNGIDHLASLPLQPGEYSLRILVRNVETGRLGARILRLPVPEPAALDPSPPLSPPPDGGDPMVTARSTSLGPLDPPPFPDDARRPAGGTLPAPVASVEVAAPPLLATADGRKLRNATREAYLEALHRLSAGQEAEALGAVAALEDSVLRRADMEVRVEDLVEIEADVAGELAAVDPESLVPLLRLHRRLYEDATVRRRLQGSAMARETFLRLVDLYRQSGQTALARRFEATFGVLLLRSGVHSRADQLFRRVLVEDPSNEMILLEMATSAERRSLHEEAMGYLEALLRAQPKHREARLRRALDLKHLGRTADASEALRGLIGEETVDWCLHIAYQELARLLMAGGVPGAEKLLREGLARLPGDEKLTLLLAAALERGGLRGEARDVLARFKLEGDAGGGAARQRYNHPPENLVETQIADLDREAAERLPALAVPLKRVKK
jgi:tetratricopeptide (TPR) repeat protein